MWAPVWRNKKFGPTHKKHLTPLCTVTMEKQIASSQMKNPVNIIRSEVDLYYRYKMPKLVVETTGKNQATTTKVSNLVDIALALKTEPECTFVFW